MMGNNKSTNQTVVIPKIATSAANTTTWTPLAIVSDARGKINGVGVADAHLDKHYMRIKIDGNTVGDGKISSSIKNAGNGGIQLGLPFNEGFRVEIRDDTNPTSLPTFWVSYIIEATDA